MRWLLILLVALLVFNRFGDALARFGLGRLPGDLRLRVRGREWRLPLGSSVVLALIAAVLAWLK